MRYRSHNSTSSSHLDVPTNSKKLQSPLHADFFVSNLLLALPIQRQAQEYMNPKILKRHSSRHLLGRSDTSLFLFLLLINSVRKTAQKTGLWDIARECSYRAFYFLSLAFSHSRALFFCRRSVLWRPNFVPIKPPITKAITAPKIHSIDPPIYRVGLGLKWISSSIYNLSDISLIRESGEDVRSRISGIPSHGLPSLNQPRMRTLQSGHQNGLHRQPESLLALL